MAIECVETQEWIEETVWQQVEQWVEEKQQVCKDWPWPLDYFCKWVTALVLALVWVAVTVGKWVVRTVCKIVGAFWTLLRDFFVGLWNILAGIFTLDWCRIVHGALQAAGGIVDGFLTGFRVFSLLDTLDYIITEIRRNQLKAYVRTKLGFKYGGEVLQEIIASLHLNGGVFGFRMNMRAIRVYLDSETLVEGGNIPNLVALSEAGLNVKELCGFDFTEGCFNRKRFKTLKKGLHASGGGGLGSSSEPDNPISEEELDLYLSSKGTEGPKFIVLPMSEGDLDTKLRAGELKARELGIIPTWTKELVEITRREHIVQEPTILVNFLAEKAGRRRKSLDFEGAHGDLCTPTVVGIFRYVDGSTLRGWSATLYKSKCEPSVGPDDASGATFIDNQPDIGWKYVPIHEIGHCLGLCHVTGIENVMWTPKARRGEPDRWWNKIDRAIDWTTPKMIFLTGEPTFTLDEAMRVWDYIIDHYSQTCLGADPRRPIAPANEPEPPVIL